MRSITQQGYWVQYADSQSGEYGHCFCGPNRVSGAWCPTCRKPLLRILSLDTSDPRLGLMDCGLSSLPLLYCWTCEIAWDQFFYQVQPPEGTVHLLKFASGSMPEGHYREPYVPYPDSFPETPVRLVPLTNDQQWLIHESTVLSEASSLATREFRFQESDDLLTCFRRSTTSTGNC